MSKEITITVNYGRKKTKEFDICIVPNRFNLAYTEYNNKVRDLKKVVEKWKIAKTSEELKKLEPEIDKLNPEGILNDKLNLVAIVLYANEYIDDVKEFDQEWWCNRVSQESLDNFIAQCALKDTTGEKKKEILKRSLSIMGF